jgi:hypothetical protein
VYRIERAPGAHVMWELVYLQEKVFGAVDRQLQWLKGRWPAWQKLLNTMDVPSGCLQKGSEGYMAQCRYEKVPIDPDYVAELTDEACGNYAAKLLVLAEDMLRVWNLYSGDTAVPLTKGFMKKVDAVGLGAKLGAHVSDTIHLADVIMALTKGGALKPNGPGRVQLSSLVKALASQVDGRRFDPEWGTGQFRDIPNLRGRKGKRRRKSIQYKDEMMRAAKLAPGVNAARLEVAGRVLAQARIPHTGGFTEASPKEPDPRTDPVQVPDLDMEEEPGVPTSAEKVEPVIRPLNTKWEWPVMCQQLYSARRLVPHILNALHIAMDGVRLKALGEINLYFCSVPSGLQSFWLPVQDWFERACVGLSLGHSPGGVTVARP